MRCMGGPWRHVESGISRSPSEKHCVITFIRRTHTKSWVHGDRSGTVVARGQGVGVGESVTGASCLMHKKFPVGKMKQFWRRMVVTVV